LFYYQGDGRPFWKLVVSEATGCANDDYFEEVYEVIIHSFITINCSKLCFWAEIRFIIMLKSLMGESYAF